MPPAQERVRELRPTARHRPGSARCAARPAGRSATSFSEVETGCPGSPAQARISTGCRMPAISSARREVAERRAPEHGRQQLLGRRRAAARGRRGSPGGFAKLAASSRKRIEPLLLDQLRLQLVARRDAPRASPRRSAGSRARAVGSARAPGRPRAGSSRIPSTRRSRRPGHRATPRRSARACRRQRRSSCSRPG